MSGDSGRGNLPVLAAGLLLFISDNSQTATTQETTSLSRQDEDYKLDAQRWELYPYAKKGWSVPPDLRYANILDDEREVREILEKRISNKYSYTSDSVRRRMLERILSELDLIRVKVTDSGILRTILSEVEDMIDSATRPPQGEYLMYPTAFLNQTAVKALDQKTQEELAAQCSGILSEIYGVQEEFLAQYVRMMGERPYLTYDQSAYFAGWLKDTYRELYELALAAVDDEGKKELLKEPVPGSLEHRITYDAEKWFCRSSPVNEFMWRVPPEEELNAIRANVIMRLKDRIADAKTTMDGKTKLGELIAVVDSLFGDRDNLGDFGVLLKATIDKSHPAHRYFDEILKLQEKKMKLVRDLEAMWEKYVPKPELNANDKNGGSKPQINSAMKNGESTPDKTEKTPKSPESNDPYTLILAVLVGTGILISLFVVLKRKIGK